MLLLATTTLEKLEAVPTQFWINALLVIFGGVIAFILVRHAAKMNKYILSLLVALFLVTIGFHWVYERNEPRALTPIVNVLAQFLPSKGYYASQASR